MKYSILPATLGITVNCHPHFTAKEIKAELITLSKVTHLGNVRAKIPIQEMKRHNPGFYPRGLRLASPGFKSHYLLLRPG